MIIDNSRLQSIIAINAQVIHEQELFLIERKRFRSSYTKEEYKKMLSFMKNRLNKLRTNQTALKRALCHQIHLNRHFDNHADIFGIEV